MKPRILREGIMELPWEVYEPMAKFLFEYYKTAKENNVKRMTEKSFPEKKFDLDLSNTKYKELMNLTPSPSIILNVTANDPRYLGYYNRYHPKTRKNLLVKNSGFINVTINPQKNTTKSIVETLFETLEHELLHHIQFLYKYKKKIDYGMTKKVTDTDIHGYKSGSASGYGQQRRTTHYLRPIEFQTNLNSLIRKLEIRFHSVKRVEPDIDKKTFFKFNIRNYIGHIKNEEIRKSYLKTSYDYFVNGNSNMGDLYQKYIEGLSNIKLKDKLEMSVKKKPIKEKILKTPLFDEGPSLMDFVDGYSKRSFKADAYVKNDFHYILKSYAPKYDRENPPESDDYYDFVKDADENFAWYEYWSYLPGGFKIPYLRVNDSYDGDGSVVFTIDPVKVSSIFMRITKSNIPEWFQKSLIEFYINEVLVPGYYDGSYRRMPDGSYMKTGKTLDTEFNRGQIEKYYNQIKS